jgi:imidazolonepropionase-like amidohydrolase
MKKIYSLLFSLLLGNIILAQKYAIIADKLIDVKNGKVIENPIVVVLSNKIIDVNTNNQIPNDATIIKLDGYTLMPGMINCHTHILSDGLDYNTDIYSNSPTYRALRSVKYLSLLLQYGFTSIRDLGSEGASLADTDIVKAIDSGYIAGPRLFSAGRGIAATSSYVPRPRTQNWEASSPSGAQYASGKDDCIKVVRKQSNSGQKWIKLFSDWGNHGTFSAEEINSIVAEAKKYKIPVAAHAKTKGGIQMSIAAGVRSIEHGDEFNDELITMAVKSNVFWCPTMLDEEHTITPTETKYKFLNKAYKSNLKIVCGSDSGSLSWKINPAKEIELFVSKAGFSPIDAIRTSTLNGAQLLQKENEFGAIEIGFMADIIGFKGNPLNDISLLQKVSFVMKNGIIYKQE